MAGGGKVKNPTTTGERVDLQDRLDLFLTERYPFARQAVLAAIDGTLSATTATTATSIEALRDTVRERLTATLDLGVKKPDAEVTPGIDAQQRMQLARDELIDAVDGWMRRESIAASLTPAERTEILRGMILTRATDNRLKAFFLGGEVRYRNSAFQGKGFRSLGQEAIYAAGLRLRSATTAANPSTRCSPKPSPIHRGRAGDQGAHSRISSR